MLDRVLKVKDLLKSKFKIDSGYLSVKDMVYAITSNYNGDITSFNPALPLDNWPKPVNPAENSVSIVKFTGHVSFYTFGGGNWQYVFSFAYSASGGISSDVPNYLSLGTDGLPLLSSIGGGGGSYLITVANTVAGHKIADIFDGDVTTYPINETVTGWINMGNGVWRYTGESGVTQDLQTNLQLSGDVTTPSAASGVTTISNNAVTEDKINNGAVTVNKIGAGAVTEDKIASSAVTVNKIGAGAVIASKIADATITFIKLAQNGATPGQVIQWNGSAWIPVTLALGEVNTGLSLGTGADVYKEKVGVQLRFRSILKGTNITIDQEDDELVINASCPCSTNLFQDGAIVRFTEEHCATVQKWQYWDPVESAWVVFPPAASNTSHDFTGFGDIIVRVNYETSGGCSLYSNSVTYV